MRQKGTTSALKCTQSEMEGKEMHSIHTVEQKKRETLPVASSGLVAAITGECGSKMRNVKTFPTGKEEMNIQCQMPMGLLSTCAGTWLFFTKIETVKTIVSN